MTRAIGQPKDFFWSDPPGFTFNRDLEFTLERNQNLMIIVRMILDKQTRLILINQGQARIFDTNITFVLH